MLHSGPLVEKLIWYLYFVFLQTEIPAFVCVMNDNSQPASAYSEGLSAMTVNPRAKTVHITIL